MEDATIARPTNEIALDDLASKIRTEHDAVQRAVETATEHAIRCGRLLTEAKDGLVHGQWLSWLEEHCEVSERTAQAYMRLARKHGELDDGKAQRVADLPVREAMKAIADERAEVPVPPDHAEAQSFDIWGWADKQVRAPINAFDLDHWNCARDKVHSQLGVPAVTSMLLDMHTDGIPMLRLAPYDQIFETLVLLAPLAKGDFGGLDVDVSAGNMWYVAATLTIVGQRDVVLLFDELEYRDRAYKVTRSRPADAVDEQYRSDCKKISNTFLADSDRRRAELRAEGCSV